MKNILIGTAGHIDHGKTTLIKFLTGKDTDTLPEEKKRGITIDLGFSHIDFPDGCKIGIIDVPGHEKFIKNMTAGAVGINYLILTVACDDGVMPQTVEHFNIAKLLNIKYGIIVLTKTDSTDEERKEEVKKQIKELVKNSFLENVEIVETSLKNPSSYENLKNILWKDIKKIKNFLNSQENLQEKKDFIMSVDRCFSIKGFGTVATGTVSSGKISKGENVNIYPLMKKSKVKKIEVYGEEKEKAEEGERCALNLSGIEKSEIKRGDVVSSFNDFKDTERADAEINILENFQLKNNQRVKIHLGTREILGRIKIFGTENTIFQGKHLVQIFFEEKVLCFCNDYGIVRTYSPATTMAGIKILNPFGEKTKRNDVQYIENFKKILKNGIDDLKEKNCNVCDIEKILKKYHEENPLKRGIKKSDLKNIFFKNTNSKEFKNFLEENIKTGRIKSEIVFEKEYVSLADFKIKLSKEQKILKDKIFKIYKEAGFNLVKYSEVKKLFSEKSDFSKIHSYMTDEGIVIFLEEDFFILKGFLKETEKLICGFIEKNNKIYIKETRELLKVDRKTALMILKKLDNMKIIRQKEDYRILVK